MISIPEIPNSWDKKTSIDPNHIDYAFFVQNFNKLALEIQMMFTNKNFAIEEFVSDLKSMRQIIGHVAQLSCIGTDQKVTEGHRKMNKVFRHFREKLTVKKSRTKNFKFAKISRTMKGMR